MNVFDSFFSFISSIFDFFINTITSLLLLINMLLNSHSIFFGLLGYLPSILGTAGLIFISVSVIKFIVGR